MGSWGINCCKIACACAYHEHFRVTRKEPGENLPREFNTLDSLNSRIYKSNAFLKKVRRFFRI